MTSYVGIPPNSPKKYLGPNVATVSIVTRNRQPTGADIRQGTTGQYYPIGSFWIISKNPTTGSEGDLYWLSKIVANVAFWVQAGATDEVITFVTDSGSAMTLADVVNVVGTSAQGISTSGTGNTVTVTIADWTTTQKGVGVLATNAETIAGSVTTKAVTPDDLKAKLGTQTSHGLPYGGGAAAALSWLSEASNGQIPIGSTGNAPVLATLTAGAGINITNAPGSITVTNTGSVSDISSVTMQVFTTPGVGTYTAPAGLINAIVEAVGGGAGGGGCGSSESVGGCGGGGSGGYFRKLLTAAQIGVSQSITIGAGGNGGSGGGANTGGSGGDTLFGAFATASGGSGGLGNSGFINDGGNGGGASGGDVNIQGSNGTLGQGAAGGVLGSIGGSGGNGFYGRGAAPVIVFTNGGANGNGATGYGAGGGGSATYSSINNPSNQSGGGGSSGIIIVTEYIS